MMTGSILACQQIDSIKIHCEIDLKKLFQTPQERARFDENWNEFIKSDPCNKKIFKLKRHKLIYQSEQLIPSKSDNRPPFLLVFGNPASHSVRNGMFFSFEGEHKEHRFWKDILAKSGILTFAGNDSQRTVEEQNKLRKSQLLELDYQSKFRIGLCVYISMPSSSSGKWSGVAGVQKLFGIRALRRLESEETRRIIEIAKNFLSKGGAVVAFQKNAWNGLKSGKDEPYSLELAKEGKLKGHLRKLPEVPLFGVPPTRLSGPCSDVLGRIKIP